MNLLGISGSLRTGSSNHALLAAIPALAAGTTVSIFDGVARLPHFSPDLDGDPVPSEVAALRDAVDRASAVLVCSPEYAHGIPGSLKNALDWLVSSPVIMTKPVVVWASGDFAYPQLLEVLGTITSALQVAACVHIDYSARLLFDARGELAQHARVDELRRSLESLRRGQRSQ